MRFCAAILLFALLPSPALPQAPDVEALVRKECKDNERMLGLKVPEIFQALGVKEGSKVADVGAGPGDFTMLLAQVVRPGGRVFAVDVDKGAVKRLHQRLRKKRLGNVEVIWGSADNPKLPASQLDAILVVDAYHEMTKYEAMLQQMQAALKPGGRLVVVDRAPLKTRNRPRAAQAKNHRMAPELVEEELRKASYQISERRDQFINEPDEEAIYWLIVARRPLPGAK